MWDHLNQDLKATDRVPDPAQYDATCIILGRSLSVGGFVSPTSIRPQKPLCFPSYLVDANNMVGIGQDLLRSSVGVLSYLNEG